MRSKECDRFYVVSPSSRLEPEDNILYYIYVYCTSCESIGYLFFELAKTLLNVALGCLNFD